LQSITVSSPLEVASVLFQKLKVAKKVSVIQNGGYLIIFFEEYSHPKQGSNLLGANVPLLITEIFSNK
jgi:hypothetical protein